MATAIRLKKSSVAGKVPVAGDLTYGELAINYEDGKLFYKNSSNAVVPFLDSANTDSLVRSILVANDSASFSSLTAAGLSYPSTDGTVGQGLITDGNGNLSFGEVGIDSDAIIALIDSDYVQLRQRGTIGGADTVALNTFSGDSSTTNFVLSQTPYTEQHALVLVNGVVQQTDSYSLTGSTLSLNEAPITGDDIEVRTFIIQRSEVEVRDFAQYVYQPSSATTTFSGNDINSNSLKYDIGKLDVFLNGAKLVNGLDYTATTGSSVTLLGDAADSGDTIVVSSFARSTINAATSRTSLTTTDSDQPVDSFDKTVSRTAKFIVQMTQGSRYHSQEVMLLHDGTTAYMTTYSDIYTESDLGSLDADISGDAVRLLVTPNYTNTTVKTTRTEIEV